MRVHELDEAYEVTKEQVRTALEFAGLKTHHSVVLDEEELGQFEGALELTLSAEEPTAQPDGAEVKEEAEEASEVALVPEDTPDTSPVVEFDPEVEYELINDEVIEIPATAEVMSPGVGDSPVVEIDLKGAFPVVDASGRFVEWCQLDQERFEKVSPVVGDRKLVSHVLDLDRDEFRAMTWPDFQSVRVTL